MISKLMRMLGYRPADEVLLGDHAASVLQSTEHMLRQLENRTAYQDRILRECRNVMSKNRIQTHSRFAGETIWYSDIVAGTITADKISVGSITMKDGLFVPAEPEPERE